MSDIEDKVIQKGSDLGESFSDLMKKVVEKQLEEENAITEDLSEAISELDALEEKTGSDVIIKSEEAANSKPIEVPVFEWKEAEKPVVESFQPVSEVGVISTMTTINGTVSSKGHIRIEGNVIGDVFAYGDVKVTGKVAGDIEGGNIELGGCIVDGDVKARGDVNIGKDSTLSGNMSGQLITIDGKIKGNVEASKGAHMSSTSLVKGSITSPTLSMSAGAELQGKVNVSKDDNE
ncbi:MAG TPA: polymer-forming cytoskeletal protein [Anaerovoracaceae bacterium]|nr:polymer-forming cytoskeletal protein [Anaerovoracaceae bacterium]